MKYLKKFNESISIIEREKFQKTFKVNIEDIEDYLTELSDDYDVIVCSMNNHPVTRARIVSFIPVTIDPYSFSIIIQAKSEDESFTKDSSNFNTNAVMKIMLSFINRIAHIYPHIKFDKYESKEYKSGLKLVEYIFKRNIFT